jgi:hypothetical protein
MVNYVVSMVTGINPRKIMSPFYHLTIQITRILELMLILDDRILLTVIQITQRRDTLEQLGCVGARRGTRCAP